MKRVLDTIPRLLSSKPHIVFLAGLGCWLVVLPLLGVHVSPTAELIGGNYTNVTSDIGACIAAGGTLHLVRKHGEHKAQLSELHGRIDELHAKLDNEGNTPT